MSAIKNADKDFNFHVLSTPARIGLSKMYKEISADANFIGKLEAFKAVMELVCSFGDVDPQLVSKLIEEIKNETGVTFDGNGQIADADDRGIRALSTLTNTH